MSVSHPEHKSNSLDTARFYAGLGWSVVPVRPKEKIPSVPWAQYQREAAPDAQLHDWFATGGYGIGLVQGAAAGTIVLDFDGEDGMATRARLEEQHGPLPNTVEALTPGGGCHVILRHPGRYTPTRKGILPGFDVRGDGGFIVAHPSIHHTGRRYEWDIDHHPEDVQPAFCPAWVADIICDENLAPDAGTAVISAVRPGMLSMPEQVISDGRETYMRNTILAVLSEMMSDTGLPNVQQLFEAVWPQYSRRVDLSRPGRGRDEVMAKCRYTLARAAAGIIRVKPNTKPDMGIPISEQNQTVKKEPQHDPETGEIIAFSATSLWDLDLDNIQPRQWLYGRELIKGFVSVLGSPGGVGKTGYAQAVGVSICIGRSLLAHDQEAPSPFQTVQKTGAVWLYNLEDPADELSRRMKAILLHYRLSRSDFKHGIYVDSGRDRPLIITKRTERGDLVAHPIKTDLVAELKRREIVLLVIDPFVQSHTAEENRNEEMNLVMALWGQVAHEAGCAVWLVHHFRKGGTAGDGDSFRGAGAIQGAARVMSTLSAMTPDEANKLGVDPDHRRQYVRLDSAKANMAPSAERAEWFKLVSVAIGNKTADYPEGDSVQTVEAWEPPSSWDGISWDTINTILARLKAGPSPDERYAAAKQAKDRWAGHVIVEVAGKTDAQSATIIRAWIENGLLEQGTYASPAAKGRLASCVSVNPQKAAEMRAQAGVSNLSEEP